MNPLFSAIKSNLKEALYHHTSIFNLAHSYALNMTSHFLFLLSLADIILHLNNFSVIPYYNMNCPTVYGGLS